MRSTFAILLAAALAACAPSLPLSRDEAARLASAPPIAVLAVRSPAPWVDCPNDEGEKVWERGAAVGSAAPVPAAPPPIVLASGIWRSYEEQWTEPLQKPPVDPATATAAQLLSRVRARGIPLPLAAPAEEVAAASPAALRDRFGDSPVLVVEAVRWVLVGCFFTYRPWFDVRATLLRPSTGQVLWRDGCGGTYPEGPRPPATRDELSAWNGQLYRQFIEERAAACATELADRLAAPGRT